MNNFSLFVLGLALLYVPASVNGKECFSQKLDPSYPCCEGDKVVLTDESGDWGIENGKWCGIGGADTDSCFSIAYGYPCCKGDTIVLTDSSGDWGVENGKWCGIGNGIDTKSDTCFAETYGYSCCESCEVIFSDGNEHWGKENKQWCGIKDSCNIKTYNTTDIDFTFLKLENNKENMLYSPLSIKYALNMLQEGADNNTYDEINKVIGNKILTKYQSIDKILSIANGLFIKDTYYNHMKSLYIRTLKAKYDAEVIKDGFEDAQNVNQWIEDKTLGIIKNILKDDQVNNTENVLMIINALAIDMEWPEEGGFSELMTNGRTFYLDDGQEIEATTMFRKFMTNIASYYINDDVTVVSLDLEDYGEVQFEFMAIMPKENLSGFVENVTEEQISQIDEKLILASDEEYGVELFIPKFKFNYDLQLKDDLKELGIKEAFDENSADFSKMSNGKEINENLYISKAIHKADIEFSEEGIKAAAVTVFSMGPASGPMKPTYPVEIRINKPFMFIIRDKNTKDIWFTGTVYQPNLWENDQYEYEPLPW